jgi:hypothetical protein
MPRWRRNQSIERVIYVGLIRVLYYAFATLITVLIIANIPTGEAIFIVVEVTLGLTSTRHPASLGLALPPSER